MQLGKTRQNKQLGTAALATIENEYTYVSCIDEFPFMLSCTAQVIDTESGNEDLIYASSNNDIQFYGTFQVPSTAPIEELNDENLYFSLETGTTKFMPLAPTVASDTSLGATPSPTAIVPTVSGSTAQLHIIFRHALCGTIWDTYE